MTFWYAGGLAAFLVGFSKTGVPGLGIVIVPLMVMIFPAKQSVGALLIMLIVGDLFALGWYRHHADWKSPTLLTQAHSAGPRWFATPFMWDFSIPCFMPVYPGDSNLSS